MRTRTLIAAMLAVRSSIERALIKILCNYMRAAQHIRTACHGMFQRNPSTEVHSHIPVLKGSETNGTKLSITLPRKLQNAV